MREIWTSIKIVKLGDLNELAYEDLIVSINTSSSIKKVAFGLVKNGKSAYFPKGSCKIEWDRLVSKYAPHAALSLLKLKCKFHKSKLELMEKNSNQWISNLEGLQICINEFGQKGNITEDDFMICVLNNLAKEYNVILDGLENHLTATGDDVLTIDVIRKKLNHWHKKVKSKKEEKEEKEKAIGAYNKQFKQRCHDCS